VSGRYEQLGRQLRKVRSSLAKHDARATSVALRRATHLASDLVLEHIETGDVAAGIAELVTAGRCPRSSPRPRGRQQLG
jgi:hypothetical protein